MVVPNLGLGESEMRTIQAELAGLGVVVTGGTRGIGEAIVTALAENAARQRWIVGIEFLTSTSQVRLHVPEPLSVT